MSVAGKMCRTMHTRVRTQIEMCSRHVVAARATANGMWIDCTLAFVFCVRFQPYFDALRAFWVAHVNNRVHECDWNPIPEPIRVRIRVHVDSAQTKWREINWRQLQIFLLLFFGSSVYSHQTQVYPLQWINACVCVDDDWIRSKKRREEDQEWRRRESKQ